MKKRTKNIYRIGCVIVIHVVFGDSATGSLKHAFRGQNLKIIGFPIDFSIGPITNIHENSGIKSYFTWLEYTFQTVWGNFGNNQTVYKQSLQKLLDIKDGEQVTIWTCENATEQIGLRIICSLLKEKQVELNVVNTYKAMLNYAKHRDVRSEIRYTGEFSAEQLASFYKLSICHISEDMKRSLGQDAEKLLQSTSIVRSWKQGEIIHELEARDDSFIMECVRRLHNENQNIDFLNATRVIGEVIGLSEHVLSDAWIECRVRSLILSGQLAYKGNLQSMRMYKIKEIVN